MDVPLGATLALWGGALLLVGAVGLLLAEYWPKHRGRLEGGEPCEGSAPDDADGGTEPGRERPAAPRLHGTRVRLRG